MSAMGQAQEILKKSDSAPFAGVLIPERTYRDMMADSLAGDELERALRHCAKDYEEREANQPNRWLWFQGGVIGGLLIGLIIKN